jgi:hypothetical protein
MNERAKRVSPQPIPTVFEHHSGPDVPPVAGIGERDRAARTPSGAPEQSFHIGVTTHDAVESDDISVWQGVRRHGEVTEEELSGAGGVASGEMAPRGIEIARRCIRECDACEAGGGEFHSDHPNSTTDVEQMKPL